MSSSYIRNFIDSNGTERKATLSVIDDLEKGKGLEHYKKRYVADNMINSTLTDWKKRYSTSNYMSFILEEYMGYINKLTKLNKHFMRKEDGSADLKKEALLESFFKLNSWNSLFKTCVSNRKKNGDVYLYWYLVDVDGKHFPKLKFLNSKNIELQTDADDLVYAYVYDRLIDYTEESPGNTGEFVHKTKQVRWVFKKGQIDIYEEGRYLKTEFSKIEFKDEIPIIHLQFLKEEDSPYSTIPAENFIDLCLELDRIESQIAFINTLMGAPQLLVRDASVDIKNSSFGANGILYIDSILKDITGKVTPGAVQQLEITNNLQSLTDERAEKKEILYNKANLVSPSIYAKLATTDSSKVWDSVRKDLEQEIKDLYNEFIDKFSNILYILFKINGYDIKEEEKREIAFEMPEYIIDKTIYDKYQLKAQKMNLGELSITENLRNEGYNEKDITRIKKEYNEEKMANNEDLSFAEREKVKTIGEVGVDNQFKQI